MKKPEEIKKGLECCIGAVKCEQCPYKWECDLPFGNSIEADALAYIQQLEAQNAELLEKVKQLERERNAAIFDLEKMGRSMSRCITCGKETNDRCTHGQYGNCYEWRGLCEENGGKE